MYHRGGDRDWHHGHHQRDGPPPRNHTPRPYRGGYRDHREHNSYSEYHDYSPYQDRNYSDNQYMNNQEHPYHDYQEDNRQYHGYRDPRAQDFYRGGRHDSSYQKDCHGRYQQSYPHKRYPYKSPKPYRKEDDVRVKPGTPKSGQSVVHRSFITLTDSCSENVPLKDKSPAREGAKPAHEDSKPVQDVAISKEHNISTQHKTKLSENEAQFTEGGAEPSEEDTELSDDNQEHSKEEISLSNERGNPVNDGIKIKLEDAKSDLDEQSVEPVCATTQNTTEMMTQPSCSTGCLTDTKEDVLQTQPVIKEEEIPLPITTGKRSHSEDRDFCSTEDDTEEESFFSKRMRTWRDEDRFHVNKTVEIPLLDGWADVPLDSAEMAGTSTQRRQEPAVDCELTNSAKELRKAFILAKKEEIELAFSQDCRTFAFVANTLLKKDPSMEGTVTNALRSALQDIAGRCVQELRNFVDEYDNVIVNASNRLQK